MEFSRRTFLIRLVKGILITIFSPVLSSCAKISRKQDRIEKRLEHIKESKSIAPKSQLKRGSNTKITPLPDIVAVTGDDPQEIVRVAVERIGGISTLVKPGSRVLIKPNILCSQKPEYAATTNPRVIAALIVLCKEAGATEIVVADRPTTAAAEAYRITGIAEATQKAGGKIKILTERNFIPVDINKGKILRRASLLRDMFESDVFINVPIAKTHSLAGLTLAMKNMMGTMGGFRSPMHINFDQKIVDLNTVIKPHLVVLDAYRILVRHGPTGGNLADVENPKTVVVGTNPVSIDAYATRFFDMKPSDLEYLVLAYQQGLGEIDLHRLQIEEISM